MISKEKWSHIMGDQSLASILELDLPELDEFLFSPPEAMFDMFDTLDKSKQSEEKKDETQASEEKTTTRRSEEFPGDIRAFFGHPLTAATTAINGDALALLHEYNNLPAIEKDEDKTTENSDFLTNILSEGEEEKCEWQKSSDVDQFLNSDTNENKENNSSPDSQQENERTPGIPLTEATNNATDCETVKVEPKLSSCCAGTASKTATTANSSNGTEAEPLPTTRLNETTKKILLEKLQKKRRNQCQNNASSPDSYDASELNYGSTAVCPIKKDGFLQQLSDDGHSLTPVSVPTTANSPASDVFDQCSDSLSAIEETSPMYQWTNIAITSCQQVAASHTDASKSSDFYYNNFPQPHYAQQNCYPGPVSSVPKYADLTNYKPTESYLGPPQSFSPPDHFAGFHNQRSPLDYNRKSPDSGIGDSCMSPVEPSMPYHNSFFPYNAMHDAAGPQKIAKRRRSSSSVRQMCYPINKNSTLYAGTAIPKLEYNTTGYRYILESPISTSQRIDEDRMTYLNKGQFYTITFDNLNRDRVIKSATVKSVISVVFRDDKTIEEELKAWEFWHSRQHSLKQRVLDIDTKNSEGIITNCIEELALNSVAVRWNPREGSSKLSLSVNCLSTDFSNQKGVKGLPLHVQIDTYEDMRPAAFPVHRCYCQIKVFCDKGAERKTRDEEKRKEFKDKNEPRSPTNNGRRRQEEVFHPPCDRSEFYAMADLQNRPLLFNPVADMYRTGCESPLPADMTKHPNPPHPIHNECPPNKRQRLDSFYEPEKVLLYVREKTDKVFTALLLLPPTLTGLAHAIQEKYGISPDNMKTIYKRSKKGILVKLDDNIIKHYSNESMFVIEIEKVENTTDFEITLAEIDVD